MHLFFNKTGFLLLCLTLFPIAHDFFGRDLPTNVLKETIAHVKPSTPVRLHLYSCTLNKLVELDMNARESTEFFRVIPESTITSRGLIAQIVYTDTAGQLRKFYPAPGRFLYLRLPSITIHTDTGRWQMISIPFNPDSNLMQLFARALGAPQTGYWRLCRYQGAHRKYLDYDPALPWTLEPGQAFWLFTRRTAALSTGPLKLDSLNDFTDTLHLSLKQGWNQIGLPNPAACSTSRLVLGESTPFLFSVVRDNQGNYRNIQLNLFNDTLLQPWEGYWVHNPDSVERDLLFLPPLTTKVKRAASRAGSIWLAVFSLETTMGGKTDNYLELFRGTPKPNLEPPPAMGSGPDISISLPGQAKDFFYIAMGNSSDSLQGVCITLKIKGLNQAQPARIRIQTLEGANPFHEFAFIDSETRTISLNRDIVELQYPAQTAERNFVFVSGHSQYVQDHLQKMLPPTSQVQFLYNVPNPFQGTTKIYFQAPTISGYNRGFMNIYTPDGRCIRNLRLPVAAGSRVTVIWDGRNTAGALAAAGNYLIRVDLSDRHGHVRSYSQKAVMLP